MSDTPPLEPEWEVITGQALLASKSPWGTLISAVIAWAVARYGFNLDQVSCNLLAGAAVVLGSYAMRLIEKRPITGIFHAKPLTVKFIRR
jgi:hypothetical protein